MEEKRGKAREPGMPQEDMGPCVEGLPAGAEMAGSTADSQERREPELRRGGSREPGLDGATRGGPRLRSQQWTRPSRHTSP